MPFLLAEQIALPVGWLEIDPNSTSSKKLLMALCSLLMLQLREELINRSIAAVWVQDVPERLAVVRHCWQKELLHHAHLASLGAL